MEYEDSNSGGIKLLDAVEALSTIVEAPLETLTEPVKGSEKINWKSVSWLKRRNKEEVITNIKEIFNVIFIHLRNSYHEKEELERIKSIMLIVGEAAKRIDRYTDLFRTTKTRSVTETKEYKQLKDFFDKKISKTIDEAVVSKWIFALSQKAFKGQASIPEKLPDSKHVYVDLDSVKKDTEYELFFIRKSDGSRFFSPRLIRNITLICDFGFRLQEEKGQDPLMDLPIWQDRLGFGMAQNVLEGSKQTIQEAYPLIIHHKDLLFCSSIHKAILALYLAANQKILLSSGNAKGCLSYLADFHIYLRKALESRSYQHMIAFPNQEHNAEDLAGKKIIDRLLKCVFENKIDNERLHDYFRYLTNEGNAAISHEHRQVNLDNPIWSKLACTYAALQKLLRNHSSRPINKIISAIEEGTYRSFDPILMQRFPENLFKINLDSQSICIHQMPSPTIQEVINQANPNPEWLAYLHERKEPLLLINFQDDTSWREYARAKVLENLQEATEFKKKLLVVTLPKDTEFYFQDPPYEDNNRFIDFKSHLIEHVIGEQGGFYFPKAIKSHLTKEWLESVISFINRSFFSGKNVLSKNARMDFIEILYAFLELKLLEITKARDLFFSCKDGVDVSPAAALVLFVLLKQICGESISNKEMDYLNEIIYRPALLSRERLLLPERADRMFRAIKALESGFLEFGEARTKELKQEVLKCGFAFAEEESNGARQED